MLTWEAGTAIEAGAQTTLLLERKKLMKLSIKTSGHISLFKQTILGNSTNILHDITDIIIGHANKKTPNHIQMQSQCNIALNSSVEYQG